MLLWRGHVAPGETGGWVRFILPKAAGRSQRPGLPKPPRGRSHVQRTHPPVSPVSRGLGCTSKLPRGGDLTQ